MPRLWKPSPSPGAGPRAEEVGQAETPRANDLGPAHDPEDIAADQDRADGALAAAVEGQIAVADVPIRGLGQGQVADIGQGQGHTDNFRPTQRATDFMLQVSKSK